MHSLGHMYGQQAELDQLWLRKFVHVVLDIQAAQHRCHAWALPPVVLAACEGMQTGCVNLCWCLACCGGFHHAIAFRGKTMQVYLLISSFPLACSLHASLWKDSQPAGPLSAPRTVNVRE